MPVTGPSSTFNPNLLFTDLDSASVPDGLNSLHLVGHHTVGKGACDVFLWNGAVHDALDADGEGYWWTTSNNGNKSWFISKDFGTPEMVGAYGDDASGSGTDDATPLQKAVNYFDRLRLPGKYYSSATINVMRPVNIEGGTGTEAGTYSSRLRFARGLGAGFFFHRSDTSATSAGVPSIGTNGYGGAQGFRLAHLQVQIGDGTRLAYNGSNITEHGIWFKSRGLIEHVRVSGAQGHGIYCYASTSNSDPLLRGNANGFEIKHCRIENCTGAGLFLDGPDVNAGLTMGLNIDNTGGPGIFDSAFLGNTHIAPQGDQAGREGLCYYGGFVYWCVDPSTASTQQPGTGSAWFKGDATANADNWVSGARSYQRGWMYCSDSDNASCTWINPYTETGNPSFFEIRSLVIGNGNIGTVTGTGSVLSGHRGLNVGNSTEGLKVNGIKVVNGQKTAIADSNGSDYQTKINAILAAMRSHGLIAT